MHVQNHFHNILKGIRSIASYVQDIWWMCDKLTTVEHFVQETISIYTLLKGLGPFYLASTIRITSNLHNLCFKDTVAQVNSHDELVTFSNPLIDTITLDFPLTTNQT